jgi:hypothetical protein
MSLFSLLPKDIQREVLHHLPDDVLYGFACSVTNNPHDIFWKQKLLFLMEKDKRFKYIFNEHGMMQNNMLSYRELYKCSELSLHVVGNFYNARTSSVESFYHSVLNKL